MGKNAQRRRKKATKRNEALQNGTKSHDGDRERAQAESALFRLLRGNAPGSVTLAGAYAFGYGELGLSQVEGQEPEWYQDLDPLETLFLGTAWPKHFRDSAEFANACFSWLRLLKETRHWNGIERLVREAISVSEEYRLPLDSGELMLLLTGRLERAGLNDHKLAKHLLPQNALRDSRCIWGPEPDLTLLDPPDNAAELIENLKEPLATGLPHEGTAADALRAGLSMLSASGMDFLGNSPLSLF